MDGARRWAEIGWPSIRFAGYIGVSLLIGMIAREYVRALVAAKLGDPTPRLWGRLTWNPRAWFEPFGSGLLPALVLVLWAAASGLYPPPAAYGKPAPVDPMYLRRSTRDQVFVGFAGPVANVVLAAIAGIAIRIAAPSMGAEVFLLLVAFEFTQLSLAIFHLLPIPGLDGARLVALALPADARRVYRDADKYLPLFVLVLLFLMAGVMKAIVYGLVDSLCRVFSGFGCTP
jgi:Zn-dependent protease